MAVHFPFGWSVAIVVLARLLSRQIHVGPHDSISQSRNYIMYSTFVLEQGSQHS